MKVGQSDGTTKDEMVLTGSNLKWVQLSLINEAVGSNKTITVPVGKEYKLSHIVVIATTTAVVGNRLVSVTTDTGTTNNRISFIALPVVAASLTRRAEIGLQYPKDTVFDSNSIALLPLPSITLQAGDRIRIADDAAVDPANDTLKYYVRVGQRSV